MVYEVMSENYFTPEQVAIAKATFLSPFTPDEQSGFLALCERVQLDPFANEIYPVARKDRLVPVTGIGGFRKIAHRSGEHDATEAVLFAASAEAVKANQWFEVWTEQGNPFAAKCAVWKRGSLHPTVAVVRWDCYNQGKGLWLTKPDMMMAKVAEAVALRKAFSGLNNLYVVEEIPEDHGSVSGDESARSVSNTPVKSSERPAQPSVPLLDQLLDIVGNDPVRKAAALRVLERRKSLQPGQTFADLSEDMLQRILAKRNIFAAAIEKQLSVAA